MNATALYMLYVILAGGAAGLFLCLPTPARGVRVRRAGAVLSAAALAALAVYWAGWIGSGFEGRAFFVVFAVVAVVAAIRVVTHHRPVYSALYFVLVLLAVSGLCVLAAAEFLAAALVIVYGGAILVTYVFVIMLAQQSGAALYDLKAREPLAAVVLGFALVAAVTQAMASPDPMALGAASEGRSYGHESAAGHTRNPGDALVAPSPDKSGEADAMAGRGVTPAAFQAETGNVRAIGTTLMTSFVMAVEVAGLLLLVAMVGAVVIVSKQIEPEALTSAERSPPTEDLHRRGREAAPF